MNNTKRISITAVCILGMIILFGHAPTFASQRSNTSTGKPEVVINAPRAAIVESIVSRMLTLDYMLKSQTDSLLIFFQNTTINEDVNLFTSKTVQAENRITFNLVNSSGGIRIMASLVTIKNPNTSFEALANDWSRSVTAGLYQQLLDDIKYEFEEKNPGSTGLSITTFLNKPGNLVVSAVAEPAASAGIMVGDKILAVDGTFINKDRVKGFSLLRQKGGTTHDILVGRKKQQLTIPLTFQGTDRKETPAPAPAGNEQAAGTANQAGPTMNDRLLIESIGAAIQGYAFVQVTPDGPSEKAGLRKGDILTAIDGDPLSDSVTANLKRLLGKTNTAVVVTVKRDQEELIFSIIRKNP